MSSFWPNLTNLAKLLSAIPIRILGRSRSFKVIEVGINRKPVCDFLLAIISN